MMAGLALSRWSTSGLNLEIPDNNVSMASGFGLGRSVPSRWAMVRDDARLRSQAEVAHSQLAQSPHFGQDARWFPEPGLAFERLDAERASPTAPSHASGVGLDLSHQRLGVVGMAEDAFRSLQQPPVPFLIAAPPFPGVVASDQVKRVEAASLFARTSK